jgi:hypothetical protein
MTAADWWLRVRQPRDTMQPGKSRSGKTLTDYGVLPESTSSEARAHPGLREYCVERSNRIPVAEALHPSEPQPARLPPRSGHLPVLFPGRSTVKPQSRVRFWVDPARIEARPHAKVMVARPNSRGPAQLLLSGSRRIR